MNWASGYIFRKGTRYEILIGADIVPATSNQTIFENAQMEQIVDSKLYALLEEAGYRIFNLEVPLTDKAVPIAKAGANLIASTRAASGYNSWALISKCQ